MLVCPVCRSVLVRGQGRHSCEKGHSFDIAKEGYVNLLRSNKSGDKMGDDKFSARSRRDFLNKGYYSLLRDALVELFRDKSGTVLDICCGEGYYTSALADNKALRVFGFDLAKEMIRLAGKRGGAEYFVANMVSIPMADSAVDYAVELFAPFYEPEFCRVLKPGGKLYLVVPGRYHLWGLKQALYDTPYENDESLPETKELKLLGVRKLSGETTLQTPEDIEAVFRMTPYYFHTATKDREKLQLLQKLDTKVEFIIAEFIKE